MAELVANCPRCGAMEMTFDLHAQHLIIVKYKWQHWFEVFCICRGCSGSTTFVLSQREVSDKDKIIKGLVNLNKAVNQYMNIEGYISLKDMHTKEPPEFIPENIDKVFREVLVCPLVVTMLQGQCFAYVLIYLRERCCPKSIKWV